MVVGARLLGAFISDIRNQYLLWLRAHSKLIIFVSLGSGGKCAKPYY